MLVLVILAFFAGVILFVHAMLREDDLLVEVEMWSGGALLCAGAIGFGLL